MNKMICFLTIILVPLLGGGRAAENYGFPEEAVPGKILSTKLGCFYLPSDYNPDKEYPLIVLLHGLGMQDSFFMVDQDWISQAEKRDYIICSVKSKSINWDDEPGSPDIKNIHKFITLLCREYPVRKDKICLFGWSSGGHFTNIMMAHNRPWWKHRPWITAFIEGSGGSSYIMEKKYMSKGRIPERLQVPVFIFWGEMEVPHPGENLYYFLKDQGWDITAAPHPGRHNIPEGYIDKAFDWLDEKLP